MVTAIFFPPFLIDNRACTVGYAHCTPMRYSGAPNEEIQSKALGCRCSVFRYLLGPFERKICLYTLEEFQNLLEFSSRILKWQKL